MYINLSSPSPAPTPRPSKCTARNLPDPEEKPGKTRRAVALEIIHSGGLINEPKSESESSFRYEDALRLFFSYFRSRAPLTPRKFASHISSRKSQIEQVRGRIFYFPANEAGARGCNLLVTKFCGKNESS